MFQCLRIFLLFFFFNFTEHPGNPPTHEQSPAMFGVLFRCYRHNRCFLWGEKAWQGERGRKQTVGIFWVQLPSSESSPYACLLCVPWPRKWFVWTEEERYILVANFSGAHPWQIRLLVSYLSSHSATNTKMQSLNIDLIPVFALLICNICIILHENQVILV